MERGAIDGRLRGQIVDAREPHYLPCQYLTGHPGELEVRRPDVDLLEPRTGREMKVLGGRGLIEHEQRTPIEIEKVHDGVLCTYDDLVERRQGRGHELIRKTRKKALEAVCAGRGRLAGHGFLTMTSIGTANLSRDRSISPFPNTRYEVASLRRLRVFGEDATRTRPAANPPATRLQPSMQAARYGARRRQAISEPHDARCARHTRDRQ